MICTSVKTLIIDRTTMEDEVATVNPFADSNQLSVDCFTRPFWV